MEPVPRATLEHAVDVGGEAFQVAIPGEPEARLEIFAGGQPRQPRLAQLGVPARQLRQPPRQAVGLVFHPQAVGVGGGQEHPRQTAHVLAHAVRAHKLRREIHRPPRTLEALTSGGRADTPPIVAPSGQVLFAPRKPPAFEND